VSVVRSGSELVAAAQALAPLIRAHQQRIEHEQTLPRPVVDALVSTGVFRTHAPRAIGGLEVDVLTYFEVVEELSKIDASVGWLAMINCGNFYSWFEPSISEPLFHAAQPYAVASGNLAPKGRAVAVQDGFRVSGRWSFVSGVPHADWVLLRSPVFEADVPRSNQDGTPAIISVLLSAAEIEIIPTWNGLGLRGTGSHDVAVSDVFVPCARTSTLQDFYPGPLYKAWFFLLGHAAHGVGIGRAAIEALIELSRSGAAARAGALASRTEVQLALAEAEATLGAARAYVWDVMTRAYDQACREVVIEPDLRMQLKLSMTYAMRTAAHVVKLVYDAAGPPVVYEGSTLERCFRDVHTATQHSLMQTVHYQHIGEYLFARDLPDRPPLPPRWATI
jgi:indole-3-acetate monooxygenase